MPVKFFRYLTGIGLCLALAGMMFSAGADPEAVRISQFSGKPVPRFESLRYTAVHGRQGPSLDHPILWRYERAGLPMLVIRETNGWRRVRDKDGDEVWMQARMLTADRQVITTVETVLYRKADEASAKRAMLKEGVIAALKTCEGAWCSIEADKLNGWVQRAALWGVETSTDGL